MRRLKIELAVTYGCILVASTMTTLALGALVIHALQIGPAHPLLLAETIAFGVIVSLLAYGGLVYQLARAGYFLRLTRQDGVAATAGRLEDGAARPLAVLVPSYREELKILRQTVVSAALMQHPNRHIVVLLDDPPAGTEAEIAALEATRTAI